MTFRRPTTKRLLFSLIFIGLSALAFAQGPGSKSEFWSKVRFGGGIGIGFNNAGFNGAISPSAIYQATDQFAAGLSLNYIYYKAGESKLSAYGGSILSLYNPIPMIQLSAEMEQLRINRRGGTLKDNYWAPALFIGAGYSTRNVTIGIRYDLLYNDQKSIYANAWMPFFRVFF